MASSSLAFEDLSQTCRRNRYCECCFRAFCSHCCYYHRSHAPSHSVIPVDVDAAGRPVFTSTWEFGDSSESSRIRDGVIGAIAAEYYATRLPRDSYCVMCNKIFCAAGCPHHRNGKCVVLRIEERDGRYCVRCTGSEPWLPYMETILGDPVGDDVDHHGEYQLLLPVLRRAPSSCVRCGRQVQVKFKQHCSETCAAAHRREVALRRERREARIAARELAKLQIH